MVAYNYNFSTAVNHNINSWCATTKGLRTTALKDKNFKILFWYPFYLSHKTTVMFNQLKSKFHQEYKKASFKVLIPILFSEWKRHSKEKVRSDLVTLYLALHFYCLGTSSKLILLNFHLEAWRLEAGLFSPCRVIAAVFGLSWTLESANRASENRGVCSKEAHCTESNTPTSTVDDSHQPT